MPFTKKQILNLKQGQWIKIKWDDNVKDDWGIVVSLNKETEIVIEVIIPGKEIPQWRTWHVCLRNIIEIGEIIQRKN